MIQPPHILENDVWQVGILPQTGASVAFGRVRHGSEWVDVLRPTAPEDTDTPGKCASFIMAPWSNRVRDGRFTFEGTEYQLKTSGDNSTAIHGDVRDRPWQVLEASASAITLGIRSHDFSDVNFPFDFSVRAGYRLEGANFIMELTLHNDDDRRMPGGFGHHPYFIRNQTGASVLLEVPFSRQYTMTDKMPTAEAGPITEALDFRNLRLLGDATLDDLLTGREGDEPSRIVYPAWDIEIQVHSDPVFEHLILYTPPDARYFALEPVTNANDGFNLYANGVEGAGVFVLEPGEAGRAVTRVELAIKRATRGAASGTGGRPPVRAARQSAGSDRQINATEMTIGAAEGLPFQKYAVC